MPKLNPKKSKDSYKDQGSMGNRDRWKPVDGIYHMVNIKLQKQRVGKEIDGDSSMKIRVITKVLKVVEAEDHNGAAEGVGMTFGWDIWVRSIKTDKKGNPVYDPDLKYNLLYKMEDDDPTQLPSGERLDHLVMACGGSKAYDPEDDEELAKTILCRPFMGKIAVEEQPGKKKNQVFYQVDMLEKKRLSKDAFNKHIGDPDWKKTIEAGAESRWLEEKDFTYVPDGHRRGSSGGGSSGRKPAANVDDDDDGFFDDDLPF